MPNDLFDMLMRHEGKQLDEIKDSYDKDSSEIIDEYIDFLVKNEYCFFTQHPEHYPALDLQWHYPFEISNAVIDYSNYYTIETIIDQLEEVHCKNLEIRFYEDVPDSLILSIQKYLNNKKSIISALGLIIPYSVQANYDYFDSLVKHNPRISYIYFYGSPQDIVNSKNGLFENIYFFTDTIKSELHCGLIHKKSFVVNIKSFTESNHHNSCLNKKIAIDKTGNIKNCPSMTASYGNISDTTLKQALAHPEFKKYWNVTKNEVDICRDCEFRHICTDCRAYVQDPSNPLSKPLKCGYSPYTNVWEEWSTNPLKQKAIEYYNMQELVRKDA